MAIAHRNVSTSMPCVPIFLQFFPCRPYTWRDFSTSPELTNVVFGTIYPLTVPFSSPFGSFAEKRFVKGENSLNIAGKLGGNVIPKVVLRDETTRDRSAVCFETMCDRPSPAWEMSERVTSLTRTSGSLALPDMSQTIPTHQGIPNTKIQPSSLLDSEWAVSRNLCLLL